MYVRVLCVMKYGIGHPYSAMRTEGAIGADFPLRRPFRSSNGMVVGIMQFVELSQYGPTLSHTAIGARGLSALQSTTYLLSFIHITVYSLYNDIFELCKRLFLKPHFIAVNNVYIIINQSHF